MTTALADCTVGAIKPWQSSGITVSVTKTVATLSSIVIQFRAKNTGDARVYLKDGAVDPIQRALLGSGDQLGHSDAFGIQTTEGFSAQSCIPNVGCSQDLNSYSALEPGEVLPFSLTYAHSAPPLDNETITVSLAFVARVGPAGADTNKAGRAKIIRFSFADVPVCPKEQEQG